MKLNLAQTALIVVDAIDAKSQDSSDTVYQNELSDEMKAFRANVARVIDAAHSADLPVIYCNDAHIPGLDKELDIWGEHGIKDKTVLYPEITPKESDITITKRRYSGFFQTDLGLTLNELGAKTLIVVGSDTNICVAHTLADAFYRNFKTVVVEDATISFLGVGTQEGAIADFLKLYGSTIVSTADIESLLA